ncbi:hypothetical protein [Paractinoplanes atraurantiacus]|uniref:Uncharacterized protein n=1 Tax=Paractinoplanes atraurantiacus TaxID=1036182 RepID=A0A285FF84_9ACTN|nr:hypothetical protein [Actinoplanes atraurantiacus]SNY08976.1 hypothetical protein SAMN05421748_101873 [Actinoplanes atraurantiacus]
MDPEKKRYLVCHDYGMGGSWWWVWAASPEEIVESVAEIEVITDEESIRESGPLADEELHLDALSGTSLADLRDQRTAHRSVPGYGVLAGRKRVYLRDDEEGVDFLVEVGPDGRRLREVEVSPEGVFRLAEDLPNPPRDLRDPRYVRMEISHAEFEAAWERSVPYPEDEE